MILIATIGYLSTTDPNQHFVTEKLILRNVSPVSIFNTKAPKASVEWKFIRIRPNYYF